MMLLLMALSMLLAAGDTGAAERILPEVRSETFVVRTMAGGLERSIRTLLRGEEGPAWVGWAVPMIPGDRTMCCWEGSWRNRACCGRCRLEKEKNSFLNLHDNEERTTRLEGSGHFFVMFRFENGRVQKIRSFSAGCELDAGRRDVFWFDGVDPAESIEWLAAHAVEDDVSDEALTALALHDNPEAGVYLQKFVGSGYPLDTRKTAAFWLGSTRGRPGLVTLKRLLEEDTDQEMREGVVFALSQSDIPEAVDTLIRVARRDRDPDVRSEAIFWLAQVAADKAVGVIADAIRNDPETEVKRRAVFALSETPDGVTLLIDIARKNRNPAVRREAIFWLGQSDDPRALRFIEDILDS